MEPTERLFEMLGELQPVTLAYKQAVNKHLLRVTYPKNHLLVQLDSIAQYVYFLQCGFAVAYHFVGKKRIVTRFFQAGDVIVSPHSFFNQAASAEVIQLTVESELFSFPYHAALDLLEEFTEATHTACAIVVQAQGLGKKDH